MLNRVILLLALLGALLSASAASAERRVALVVGNSNYSNAAMLRNPRNDASDMAATLKRLGFDVLLGLDVDQQGFANLIGQYAQRLDGADVGLFFYAGHGLQINEKNYLVSTNAKLENEFLVTSETIDLESVVRLMELKTAINIVFLDACRNDPLAENLRRNLVAMKRGANLGRGLARIEPSGRDTLVAFAAAPGQEAADGADRNSPFTGSLLKHLPTPGLEVSVMLKQVAADVRRDTNNSQRPQQLSDMSRTFYFAPPTQMVASADPGPQKMDVKAPNVPSLPGVDDRALEIAFWNAAQASNECEAMQDYVRRFPNGNFVTLAKLAERHLCGTGRRIDVVSAPAAPAPSAQTPAPPQPESILPSGGQASLAPLAPLPSPQPLSPEPQQALVPPAPTQTAVLQPGSSGGAPAAPDSLIAVDIARDIQVQLIRLGCAKGEANGRWEASTQAALRAFNTGEKMSLDVGRPAPETVEVLSHFPDNACLADRPGPSKTKKVESKPERRHTTSRREQAEREERRAPRRERVERDDREERRLPMRVERAYPRPFVRERVFMAPPPPPVAQAPSKCMMDEGYGRMRPCDAGR